MIDSVDRTGSLGTFRSPQDWAAAQINLGQVAGKWRDRGAQTAPQRFTCGMRSSTRSCAGSMVSCNWLVRVFS